MSRTQDPLAELFADDKEETTPMYARIPSSLHAKISVIKSKTGKTFYEMVTMGLTIVVDEYDRRQNSPEKKDEAA